MADLAQEAAAIARYYASRPGPFEEELYRVPVTTPDPRPIPLSSLMTLRDMGAGSRKL